MVTSKGKPSFITSPGKSQARKPIPNGNSLNKNIYRASASIGGNTPWGIEMPTPAQYRSMTNAARAAFGSKFPAAAKTLSTVNNFLPPQYQLTPENALKAFKGVKFQVGADEAGVSNLPSFKNGSPDTSMNSSYGLSKAPNPKKVILNSGIVPNCWANDYMQPLDSLCSPMHISCCTLGIPTSSSTVLNGYFLNTLAFDIQTRAQANVGFYVDITNILSSANLLTAMNAGITGLQVYYFWTSILSYESDPRNKNSAMIALRNLITPQMLSDLTQLGRRLEDTPIPPRVVEWVRYMNMNFLSGDSQGSPLLKIAPSYDFDTSTTGPATALSALVSTTNNSVYSLLRRSIPQWKIGTLYDVPSIPVYDKNFKTIFANLPQAFTDLSAVSQKYPSVSTTSTTISYNSFNNRLDGAAYAACGIYQNSVWHPGLVVPSTSGSNPNRKSYYNQSTTYRWYEVPNIPFLISSRDESYAVTNATTPTTLTVHLFGAEKCQGVSVDSLNQTAENFLDFVFNVDSIPVKGKLSNFSKNGMNKI